MKRFLKIAGLLLLSIAVLAPSAEGRGRNNGGERRTTQQSHSQSSRPGNMGRPTHSNTTTRPGNNHRPDNNHAVRPGNNNRPGNNHAVRPGNNNRPGNNQAVRPGNNNRPGNNHAVRPPHRPNTPRPSQFGHRPAHIPHFSGWHRPAPPSHWRPAPHWRPFRTILGIALGTSFDISLNALLNSGYNVNYYGDNTIYLTNATMLNMLWPDAVMYYNGAGLCGSRFIYSSPYYDMNRYNMAYTTLTNTYGLPTSVQNTTSGIESTWWGAGNQFIRLSYMSDYAQNGTMCYFTTLSFGN